MHWKLYNKIKESFTSVIPITLIVLILNFTIAPMPYGVRALFIIGSIFLIVGMGLFTLGADMAMMPMGEQIGGQLTKSRKLWLLLIVSLIMGVMITIAEPDLQVLAGQVPAIPSTVLILTVAIGVGIFLLIGVMKIVLGWELRYILIIFYSIVFILGFLIPQEYVAVAFDSGGVTTGPITVPFILALGVGVAASIGGKSSHDDSFGLVALCSLGPILAVMILGIFFQSGGLQADSFDIENIDSFSQIVVAMADAFPHYFKDVGLALSPIIFFFILFQIFALKLPASQMIKMAVGMLYTFLGLVLFLTGVNVGFLPAGNFLGEYIGGLDYSWMLLPVGMIMGYFVVIAEPAVHVLNSQVEDISGGAITKKMMLQSLSIGVAVSIGLSMLRILTGISIWYILLPFYIFALALTFFVPKIFTAIAFDSGGVASGPMTATFLLPFSMGAAAATGGDIMIDAFGTVAMVAMTPLVTIQIMGFVYGLKVKEAEEEELDTIEDYADELETDSASEYTQSYIEKILNATPAENMLPHLHSEMIKDDILWQEIATDNYYIDIEKLGYNDEDTEDKG